MVHSPFAGSILDNLDAVIRVLELGFHPHAHGRIKRAPIGGSRIDTDLRFYRRTRGCCAGMIDGVLGAL